MIWVFTLLGALIGATVGAWLRLRRYVPKRRVRRASWGWVLFAAVLLGLSYALVAWRVDPEFLPVVLVFLAGGLVASWTDLDCHRIPDWLNWPLFAVLVGSMAVHALRVGEWSAFVTPLLCALAVGAVWFAWAAVGSLGLGDVKLALSVGLVLGHGGGWSMLAAGLTWILAIGAVWALILLARGVSKSSDLAFAPAMVLGTLGALTVMA